MSSQTSNAGYGRRRFVRQTLMAAGGLAGGVSAANAGLFSRRRRRSPNEKLNIGVIGVSGRGAANFKGVNGENIVALCDIDANLLARAGHDFPAAKRYDDFRRLIDQSDLDAVVISTPDHTHAVATMRAIKAGLHVYCEKPLTHTVSEARQILSETKKSGVVTQMGNQIHSGTNYRRVVELVQSGAIGEVHEVHVWVDGTWQTKPRPVDIVPIPADLNYEMWLGPAQYRPYHPEYLPFNWRRWWAFGGGTMADFGCHFMDLPHWALKLGVPTSVVTEGPEPDPECAPPWMIAKYEHPAREDMPPVTLIWYQGGKRPRYFEEGVLPKWGSGVLFVGAKGMLIADYSKHLLLPESKFAGFVPPLPFIPDSIGHHEEWISACKHGGPTGSDFRYAAVLTEAVCLGNVAFRTGKRIEWDSVNMKATGCPEADEFIQHDYRRGWRL